MATTTGLPVPLPPTGVAVCRANCSEVSVSRSCLSSRHLARSLLAGRHVLNVRGRWFAFSYFNREGRGVRGVESVSADVARVSISD